MFVEGFGGCLPTEGLAGPAVECESNSRVFVGIPSRQVGALREVLAKESVRVLVGAPLPGAVRVGEVDLQLGIDAEFGVLGQFIAAVQVGERRKCSATW